MGQMSMTLSGTMARPGPTPQRQTRVSESTLKHSNLLKSGIFSIGIAGQDNRNEKCLMEYYDGFWDDFGCEDSLTCLCRQVDRISLNINLFVFILVLKCVLL